MNFPSVGVIKAAVNKGCTTPMSPSIAIQPPTKLVVLSQNPTIKSAKTTTSMKAVGFAMTAKAKKSQERIRYFKLCLLSV